MRAALLLPLVVLALGTAGCGERPEPEGTELSVYPVSVRGADPQPITLAEAPERIAVLSAGAAELLEEIGAGDRIAGIPAGVSVPEAASAAELTRPSGLVDVDALAGLDADLVVASPETDQADVGRALRRSPAPVYLTPDRSIADVVRMALELGLLVGEPVGGRMAADAIRDRVAEVDERLEGVEPVNVFLDTGILITVPDDSLEADIIRRAGGQLVGTENAGQPLSGCDLADLDADVILTYSDAPELPELDFSDCPKAVPDIPVVAVNEALLTRSGPLVGQAVERVARILHPDAFE